MGPGLTGSAAAVSAGGKRWKQAPSPCPSGGILGTPSMSCLSSAIGKQGALSRAVTAPNQHPAGQPGSESTSLNKQCSPSLGLRSQAIRGRFMLQESETSAQRKAMSPARQSTFISKWQAPGPGTHTFLRCCGCSADGQVAWLGWRWRVWRPRESPEEF